MSDYVPRPRYAKDRMEQAAESKRPLFTLDVYWYPKKRRTTCTGVATDSEIDEMIERLQRIKESSHEQ